jgi:hypothetical protein
MHYTIAPKHYNIITTAMAFKYCNINTSARLNFSFTIASTSCYTTIVTVLTGPVEVYYQQYQ